MWFKNGYSVDCPKKDDHICDSDGSSMHAYHSLGASLIAQLVKNLPAMQETPVRFLGWEDLLEKD